MRETTFSSTRSDQSWVGPGIMLQRKCACGQHTIGGGTCSACNKQNEESDKVAHRESNEDRMGRAPSIIDDVLRSTGQSLDTPTRKFFESRLGHDFSNVRVHAEWRAAESAEAVNALAYTVGQDMVFGRGQYSPQTTSGRTLLAHELTHVVQQGARAPSAGIEIGAVDAPEEREADHAADQLAIPKSDGRWSATSQGPVTLRAQPKKTAPAKKTKPKVPMICGRPSRKVKDNFITRVNLDVGAHTLTIEWDDPTKAPAGSAGTHAISPGTGLCCVDCNDDTVSQTSGTLCTPKGGTWPVDHVGCVLAGHPTAKNPTYFQRGGIAIHSGNTSSPPQSHGCARTSPSISELIHDNVVPDTTEIASSGTWTSDRCYLKESSQTPSKRKDVCDGNKLKPKTPKKAKGKQPKANAPAETPSEKPKETPAPAAVPVTELAPESDELAAQQAGGEELGMIPDGPGPNNAPTGDESIGEVAQPEVGGEREDETATV